MATQSTYLIVLGSGKDGTNRQRLYTSAAESAGKPSIGAWAREILDAAAQQELNSKDHAAAAAGE